MIWEVNGAQQPRNEPIKQILEIKYIEVQKTNDSLAFIITCFEFFFLAHIAEQY